MQENAKQQIVERIKNATNILVTVGKNPSVDSLSAALSLAMMLSRLDKHATAVFSGQVPPAINFLNPDKTFENSVDSLRDFIIALDKEKADRLRYKVEDDVVRIFITPYKTVLSEKDLQFSQGDFNVELIVALGVETREDLDTAITAHGRILHDATVVTMNAGSGQSTLGSIDWSDASASSLCEMLMSLSEALQSGLLDEQIATAVLTGIVAATDRFRNEHTSPRVMTMAAQLMAAGANQQLIAAKLEEGHELPAATTQVDKDGATHLSEGKSQKVSEPEAPAKPDDGALEIAHTPVADAAPLPDPGADALKEAEQELAESLQKTNANPVAPTLSVEDMKNDIAAATDEVTEAAGEPAVQADAGGPKIIKPERSWRTEPLDGKPTFGGTLNATASDAEEAKRREAEERAKQQLLSHDGVDTEAPDTPAPVFEPTVPSVPAEPMPMPAPAFEEPTPKPLESTDDDALSFEPAPISSEGPTLAEIDSQTRGKAAEEARAAVDAALSAMPFNPAGQPLESAGAAPVFELSHDEPAPVSAPQEQPAPTMPDMAPPLPPLPDFSTLPPLPGEALQTAPPVPFDPGQTSDSPALPSTPPAVPPLPSPADPGQFKIPGQN